MGPRVLDGGECRGSDLYIIIIFIINMRLEIRIMLDNVNGALARTLYYALGV